MRLKKKQKECRKQLRLLIKKYQQNLKKINQYDDKIDAFLNRVLKW
jgi:hypothetical protein